MPSFYADFWRRLIANPPTADWLKPTARLASRLIDPGLSRVLLRQVPADYMQRIEGMAEGSGLPLSELTTALVLPDLMPMLQSFLTKLRPAGFEPPPPFPTMACSSFLSRGKYFLHGRNLDFPGVAFWDRYPVIQATHSPRTIPYIAFTTAGVPFGGITGVNEAQVSVSLHQHYSRRFSLTGQLPFFIAEEILQRARSLKEALKLIENSKVASAWAFVLTDGKTREAVIVETDARHQAVRTLGDKALTHSNFFQTAGCRAGEYATSQRMNWDNLYRSNRLAELLDEAGAALEPSQAVQFLSDHWDGFWKEEKVANRIVSQTYNIQSLVLDSERMKVWMAEGDSPIHLREYAEFDLREILDGSDGRTGVRYPGSVYKNSAKRQAKETFIASFVAAFSGEEGLARTELEKALEIDFFPEGAQILALLNWKIGQYEEAREWLQRGKTWVEGKRPERFPPEYFETSLFLARTYDLLGRRSEAVAEYARVAGHPDLEDTNLRRLAKAAGPFRATQVRKIVMPFSSYIPFE